MFLNLRQRDCEQNIVTILLKLSFSDSFYLRQDETVTDTIPGRPEWKIPSVILFSYQNQISI